MAGPVSQTKRRPGGAGAVTSTESTLPSESNMRGPGGFAWNAVRPSLFPARVFDWSPKVGWRRFARLGDGSAARKTQARHARFRRLLPGRRVRPRLPAQGVALRAGAGGWEECRALAGLQLGEGARTGEGERQDRDLMEERAILLSALVRFRARHACGRIQVRCSEFHHGLTRCQNHAARLLKRLSSPFARHLSDRAFPAIRSLIIPRLILSRITRRPSKNSWRRP